jgi:hypothetical protein
VDKGLGSNFQPSFLHWVGNGSPLSTHRFDGSLVPFTFNLAQNNVTTITIQLLGAMRSWRVNGVGLRFRV